MSVFLTYFSVLFYVQCCKCQQKILLFFWGNWTAPSMWRNASCAVLLHRRNWQISGGCHTTLSSFLHLLTYKDSFFFFFMSHAQRSCLSFPASHDAPPSKSEPCNPPRSPRWGGRWCVNVSKFWPGTHSSVIQYNIQRNGLTVVPSRSSPEAETCREPHRCGWSEPLLS